jgi:hypothetical protein
MMILPSLPRREKPTGSSTEEVAWARKRNPIGKSPIRKLHHFSPQRFEPPSNQSFSQCDSGTPVGATITVSSTGTGRGFGQFSLMWCSIRGRRMTSPHCEQGPGKPVKIVGTSGRPAVPTTLGRRDELAERWSVPYNDAASSRRKYWYFGSQYVKTGSFSGVILGSGPIQSAHF